MLSLNLYGGRERVVMSKGEAEKRDVRNVIRDRNLFVTASYNISIMKHSDFDNAA